MLIPGFVVLIYCIVNVENMKLYEPSMLDHESKKVFPSKEDLALEAQVKWLEDNVL